jgi:hypothetical protein
MMMTNQLANVGMQQVAIIGTFFDAKHQLETQRLIQIKTAEAHKDYHPSEELCVVGTNTRYFAESKRRADLAHAALAARMQARQLNLQDGLSGEDDESDLQSRLDQFIEKFCNKNDFGFEEGETGLGALCEGSNPDPSQVNADINYTQAVENQLTIDAEFVPPKKDSPADGTRAAADGPSASDNAAKKGAETIFALSANLFAHETLPVIDQDKITEFGDRPADIIRLYTDLRAMAAKRSIAHNSFAAIVGQRVSGPPEAGPFLKAILRESGIGEDEIEDYLGENPSLFAQEEMMMKKLYQNPVFYAGLYDKPENVERMGVALLALEIIQDRNIYDSLLRSEATLAALVETLMLKQHRATSSKLGSIKASSRRRGSD